MSAPARDVIDFAALERDLRGSLNADEKYQRENAAKLRAVSQKVGSYEEFRSLVLGSNLKPLQKNDREGSLRKQPWNPVVTTSNRTRHMTTECSWHGNEETQPNQDTDTGHETNSG